MKQLIDKKAHGTRRLVQRLGIWLHRSMKLDSNEKISESEREACLIFTKMLADPENRLLVSPLGNYYIQCQSQDMLVQLSRGDINIINHVYGYNVRLSQKTFRRMQEEFMKEVNKRCEILEKDYSQNVKHSLKSIIKRMQDHEQTS